MPNSPRNLIATAPDGTELVLTTRGTYTFAGLIQRSDKTWVIALQGGGAESVEKRTREMYNHADCIRWAVSKLIEETAPLLRRQFGTHDVAIDKVFSPRLRMSSRLDPMLETGWKMAWDAGYGTPQHKVQATQKLLKRIARDGYTQVSVIGRDPVTIRFQVADILASLKTEAA